MTKSVSNIEKRSGENQSQAYHIDFDRLCDNNDFAMLTEEFNTKTIFNIKKTISDPKLQIFFLKAVDLARKYNMYEDDYEHQMPIMLQFTELQSECYDYLHTEPNTPKEKVQGSFSAKERGFFLYFLSERQGVYYSGEEQTVNQTDAKELASKIFGQPETSFNDNMVPDADNKGHKKVLGGLAEKIKLLFPETTKDIRRFIDEE